MLPARTRMRRSAEFATTVRGGRRGSARSLAVHVAETDGAAVSAVPAVQVGFVVSRAVGPAVVRNRVRRRLRHLMLARLAGLPAGTKVVVRANPSAAALSSSALAGDLDTALIRAFAPVKGPV